MIRVLDAVEIIGMTFRAVGCSILELQIFMALIAGDAPVSAVQRKPCFACMIPVCRCPAFRGVAPGAVGAETGLVRIVLLSLPMAYLAIPWSSLELAVKMTFGTGYGFMPSGQRELAGMRNSVF